ncbi:hypothetical protein A1OE_827 [Candidatus Endolissoclinum faulkneri L2]|uniref:Uncharacterized protein n=1 Tax=Candidatus Endolissoclinum faulkneri L2 TaxID=1193729 RepID=K7YND6_9PROT|nr:hypothetical protein A1OE_827 [Candidatus Endolissoclinum faulkneri L2]
MIYCYGNLDNYFFNKLMLSSQKYQKKKNTIVLIKINHLSVKQL